MKKLLIFMPVLALVMPVAAFAQPGEIPDFSGTLPDSPIDSPEQVQSLMLTVLGWMFTFFMILAVIFIVWAAYLYLTAAGNEKNVDQAKKQLIYAVIAIVIALLASGFEPVILDLLQSA